MSEADEREGANLPSGADAETAIDAEQATRRGGLIIFVVIVLSLAWYLLADRFTPYTAQARVDGYVIGVAPQVGGVVTEVFVDNNQTVEAGEVLFQIDRSQYEIAVEKARSDLESAYRQVDAGSAGVESARAALRSAEANAIKSEKDLTRLQRLREQDPGTISVRRLESSQASLDSALARVSKAESDVQRAIEQMGGEDKETNAILKSARSALQKAELDLSNTLVRATEAGVITDLSADVGQFAGTGSPVLTLISIHDVWVNAEFTENNLGHMVVGSEVEILFDVMPGEVYSGKVRSIGIGVAAGSSHPPGTLPTIQNNRDWLRQAQRFPVQIDIDLEDARELTGHLRIGGQASVVAYTEGHGVLNLLGAFYIRLMSLFAYAY
ncbi:MAG: HlyD family secretion protein [Gammaproteobacteria bacterium]|nr:MAG: HlyD family secretion protein [Gammaproteobacteria bacterium]